jgi:8-oxo-dGTP pyrophosphatase MutT (NUDIX family)
MYFWAVASAFTRGQAYTLACVAEFDRDALRRSGEEYNPGEPTVPRQAASVILLRGGAGALELLLVKRNPQASFMGAAALRELQEEASVTLGDPAGLVPYSRWITPAEVKTRFDTWFYLAAAPDGAAPRPDGAETVDVRWYTPGAALDAHRKGEILLVFPTIKHLEQLGGFATAHELLDYARGRQVVPVRPRVLVTGETARVVLPGEPGYDDD